jgi:hypothetical protein
MNNLPEAPTNNLPHESTLTITPPMQFNFV